MTIAVDVPLLRQTILQQINDLVFNWDTSCHPNLDESINELTAFLNTIVDTGESNSLLVIGPRGSGKSKVVTTAIEQVIKVRQASQLLMIQLNGWIHTDDRLALLEICRQFNLNQEYSDSLVASPKSFADCLEWLLSTMQEELEEEDLKDDDDESNLPLVILLEEFDMFATHPKQTLLYNLFDLVQSRRRPIAVIGTTCRWDAVELLEKRVRSRFSNRQLHISLPETISVFSYVVFNTLKLPSSFPGIEFAKTYNTKLEELFERSSFITFLKNVHITHNDLRLFFTQIIPCIYQLTETSPFLDEQALTKCYRSQTKDYWREVISGLSVLEITLLVSVRILLESGVREFNFETLYDAYKGIFLRNMSEALEKAPKLLALKAYFNLFDYKILQHVTGSMTSIPSESRPARLAIPAGVTFASIQSIPNLPTLLLNFVSK